MSSTTRSWRGKSRTTKGEFKDEHFFLSLQPENIVLTAAKKAEDDDSLVLRFYEWAGKETDAKLRLPAGAEKVSETDLMEKPLAELSVHTKPYEIKTIRVRFAAKPASQTARSR
jgi:alpha-mannosidase